ncbi:MAG TPA: SCO family protein [Candidatus Angelobacter sp.]
MRRKNWNAFGLMAAMVLVAMAMGNAFDNARWGANYFPNVEFTDQDGHKVRFYDDLLKNKIVAINLIYTHCVDACPLETARLVQVQRKLADRMGKEIFFYSITIDPKRDTPEVLKAYAEKYHAGPGWLFLTGKQEDIDLVSKKLGLYTAPDPNNRDGHRPSLMIGNEATGQWVRESATDNPSFLSMMMTTFMTTGTGRPAAANTKNYAEVEPLNLDQGQYLFATRCSACHTIGHGDKIGPDLLGITNVRDRGWLARMIQAPDKLLEERDPIAVELFARYKQVIMPNQRLSDEDTNKIIDFLKSQSTAPGTGGALEQKAGVVKAEAATASR